MSGIFLNYCICTIEIRNPQIYSIPFLNSYDLKMQRKNYPEISFMRKGNKVFLWDRIQGVDKAKDIPNALPTIISFSEHPFIITRIIEDKIISIFKEAQYKDIYRNRYSNSWEIYSNNSLFKDDEGNDDEGLAIKRCMTISTYYSKFHNYTFGFTVATQLKHRFIWNKLDFINNHIACEDLKGRDDIIFANKVAVKRYLEARGLNERYEKLMSKENSFSEEYNSINKTIDWLSKRLKNIFLIDDILMKDCKVHYFPLPYSSGITSTILQKPKRYYANDKIGNAGKYDEQLRFLKPYSYLNFQRKSINIVSIIPNEYEGSATDFLARLKNSLINTFHITDLNIETVLVQGTLLSDYYNAVYSRPQLFQNIDLAIIFVSEKHVVLPIGESPYYFCKAKYIGQAIPTQEVQIEKLRGSGLKFIVPNVALNIYAKLGGTPWGIEQTQHLKKEFIVGIGSTIDENHRSVMGIANIFDSSGKYFVGECVPLTDFANYEKQLEDAVYSQIFKLIDGSEDEVRMIFHIYKSPSNRFEVRAMENVVQRMNSNIIKYAFVHVGYGHNFRIYNNGGNYFLEKGYYIHLSENEALVNFVTKGSTPLKITVDRRSTFKDIYYLAQQIYWFSHLSCRSYIPAKKSVTISYPSLMAAITEKLKLVEGWDYNVLQSVGDKLWFI